MKVFSRASEILSFGKSRTTPQLPNEKPNCNPVITLSGCVVEGTTGPSHTGHRHPTASCCQKLTEGAGRGHHQHCTTYNTSTH